MRVDVVDVTTASQKRWNLSDKDKWWTNVGLTDGTNAPQSLGSSDSDTWLEQELRPHDPRPPMDSIASPQPASLGSTDQDSGPAAAST